MAEASKNENANRWRGAALGFIVLWFTLGGIAHFVYTDAMVSIIPPGLPWPRQAVWITGVFELLGAVGILIPRSRTLAGWGLVALTICVTPANVYMWLHPELFPQVPEWLLLARLAFQVLLIACIAWSSQSTERCPDAGGHER